MLNRSVYPLYSRLAKAQQLMKSVQSEEELLALGNYIGNVYRSLAYMDQDIKVEPVACFGSVKKLKIFLKDFNAYNDDLMHHFVLKKDFHTTYIGEILPTVEEGLETISNIETNQEEHLNKKMFKEVLYAFLDSIQMMDLYNELMKKKSIHSGVNQEDGYLGFTIFNPINGDIDIMIGNFKYSINHLNTLVHELGHGFDLKHFDGNLKEYNQYFYLSFYGEVLSRLMERLLHRFLLKNHIIENSAMNCLRDFEDLNHYFLVQGYILSLLDSSFLLSDGYSKCDKDVLIKMVKRHFTDESKIKEFIEDVQLDTLDAFTYSYGDILSLFLCNEIERNGINNDLLEAFMRNRIVPFQESFLEENGLNPKKYQKLYKKEIELLKK